ncbi:hypothetical protein TYRP_006007 [Tyrophagus putrescentiae]|nr:hypothetical protein TYRP_006007 [Tyrophagus putrescentiae]
MITFLSSIPRRVTVEPAVLFYVFAIFAEYAVIEDLLYVSKCYNYLNLTSNDQLHNCTENKKKHKGALTAGNGTGNGAEDVWKEISEQTNNALLLYNGILYATSIVSSFVAAAYSDRRSKLVPILLPVIGSAVVQVILLLTLTLETSTGTSLIFSHTSLIFLCCLISGATGGTSTLLSNCFAFVAERCSPSQRTARITIVEACLFGGGFFAFTYAGAILRAHPNSLLRYIYNFGLFLIIHILLSVYIFLRRGLFTRPEKRKRRDGEEEEEEIKRGYFGTIFMLLTSVLKTIFRKRAKPHQRLIIFLILGAFTLISFWNVALTTLLFIYTRNEPLHWPSWMYSYFSSAKFALCGLFLCLLPVGQHLLSGRLGRAPLSDNAIIFGGPALPRTTLMVAALVAIILAEYPIPAIRSLISKVIEPNEKAQMFVFMATIQSICFFLGGIIFPLLYNAIFSRLSGSAEMIGPFNGPGVIFVTMAVLQFIAMGIFVIVDRIIQQSNFELITRPTSEVQPNYGSVEQIDAQNN